MSATIDIIGGGLAGSEAAWQLAERGLDVVLHEMRPQVLTEAHKTDRLAELVCSNTFKSTETTNAHGLLKAEMRLLGSMILECADSARVPGGSALTVDRDVFSAEHVFKYADLIPAIMRTGVQHGMRMPRDSVSSTGLRSVMR